MPAPVEGVYLIKSTADDGPARWDLRLITPERSLKVIQTVVRLRRDVACRGLTRKLGVKGVRPDNVEASRIIAYARSAYDGPLLEIIDTPIDGLVVEYALVADWSSASDRAAA